MILMINFLVNNVLLILNIILQDNDHSYTNFAKLMEINLSEFRMSDHAESDVLGPTNQYCNEEIDILTSLADKMGLVCTVGQDIVITKRN